MILILNSCKINSIKSYNKTKLSKIIELHTREIIQEETQDEFDWLKKENLKLEKKLNQLQVKLDSLSLNKINIDSNITNNFCYLFFNSSTTNLKKDSYYELNLWMLKNKKITKLNIMGYSDMSGDSLVNIKLAYDRALLVKNILTKEYCIQDSLISISSKANMISCNRAIYRSVKIQIF